MSTHEGYDGANRRTVRMAWPLLLAGLAPFASPAQTDAVAAPDPATEVAPPADGATAEPQATVVDTVPVDTGAPAAAPAPDEPQSRVGMTEIVVTAQKRAENIQDVPISIQAFSGDELDAKGITEPAKLVQITPGLVYDSVAGFSVIYIRGVGTDAFIPSADLSVATYIDGVYFPFSYGLSRAFGDVQRVEVLKGPQGTLFGRNSTGGAISIVTTDPSSTFGTSGQVSFGNFDDFQSRALMSGPVVDTVTASLGVLYNHRRDYYDPAPEVGYDNLQDYQEKGANLKIRWAPVDAFDATLVGYAYDGRGTSTALAVNIDPSQTIGGAAMIEGEDRDYVAPQNRRAQAFNDLYTASLTLNLRTSVLDFKTISAYQDFDSNSLFDFDGSAKDIASFGSKQKGSRTSYGRTQYGMLFTQEAQFISNDTSPGADWLKYVGGVYYIKSTAGFHPVEFYVAGLEDAFSGTALTLLGNSPLVNFLRGTLNGLPLPGIGSSILLNGLLDTDAVAGYTQVTATFTDWLSLTLGGRYQSEKRKVYKAGLELATLPPDGPVVPLVNYPDDRLKENNFSPKAVLELRPADDVLTYLSWSKGFKSGSFNIINLTTPPQKIKSEEVTSYELGLKSELFGNQLRLNGAVFRNEIKDLQVQFLSLISGGVVSFENAQKASINGAEVGLTWAATDELILGLNATYLDSKYNKFTDGSGFDPQTGLLSTGNDFSGNHISRTPKWTGSVDAHYTLSIPGGPLELGTSYYYNDGYYFSAQNTYDQPSYGLVAAQASYLWERTSLRITLFGDNLTDDKRYLYKFGTDFGVVGKLASPRTYGVRFDWQF